MSKLKKVFWASANHVLFKRCGADPPILVCSDAGWRREIPLLKHLLCNNATYKVDIRTCSLFHSLQAEYLTPIHITNP